MPRGFKGDYLRVSRAVTSNGNMPIIDENGRVKYKETLLPLGIRKMLETKNQTLPEILKYKIEVVKTPLPEPKSKSEKLPVWYSKSYYSAAVAAEAVAVAVAVVVADKIKNTNGKINRRLSAPSYVEIGNEYRWSKH